MLFVPGKTVVTFDGDGSLLMNPNALLEIAKEAPKNLIIIGLDNGAYGSTGSQETCALRYIDLEIFANACGIQNTAKVNSREGLIETFRKFRDHAGTFFYSCNPETWKYKSSKYTPEPRRGYKTL